MNKKVLVLIGALLMGVSCSQYDEQPTAPDDVIYPVAINSMPSTAVSVFDDNENEVFTSQATPVNWTPEAIGTYFFVMSIDDEMYDGFAGIFNVIYNVQTPPVNVSLARHGENGKDGQDGRDGEDGQDGEDGEDGQDGEDGVSYIAICLDDETIVIDFEELDYFVGELGATPGACPGGMGDFSYRVEEYDFTPNKSVGHSTVDLTTIQTRSYAVAELGYDVYVRRDLKSNKTDETIRVGRYVGEEQVDWIGDSHRAPCEEILPDVPGFQGEHMMYVGTIYEYDEFVTFVAQVRTCSSDGPAPAPALCDNNNHRVSVKSIVVGYWVEN